MAGRDLPRRGSPGHADRLTVPEPSCDNFQHVAAWTPLCSRLCSGAAGAELFPPGMQAAAIISSAKNEMEYMAGGATRPKPGRKPRRSGTLME
jgi:hypothetical protein